MSIFARKINQSGIDLIMRNEGCDLIAYLCPAGIWTIGYGHTGKDVHPDLVITQQQAERLLINDLGKFCDAVSRLVKVPVNDNQYAALVSLCFNIGEGNFAKSTLLKKLNKKDYAGAALEFEKWNRGGGKVLAGLVKRRAEERRLFELN